MQTLHTHRLYENKVRMNTVRPSDSFNTGSALNVDFEEAYLILYRDVPPCFHRSSLHEKCARRWLTPI